MLHYAFPYKKTGVYVVIGTLLLMAIPYRKQFARLLLPLFASALVMWIVLPRIVFPLLDVAPGGKQEMLAIPFQQTACYVVNHSEELSEWEDQAIDAVLHIETLPERYDPSSSDPVKKHV